MKKISIVLPTYNEKENIESSIKKILDQQKNLSGYDIHIVVSDSNSPDGTAEVVKKIRAINIKVHLIEVGRGLGVGLIKGHQYALKEINPDIMVQLDADGQVEEDVLPRLIKVIEDGYDLALGSRFVEGGKNELAWNRRLYTYGSSLFCRLTMGPWEIQEFTNSARAFTPQLFNKINLDRLPWKENSFINQPAFLHEAILAGARYKEVPLVFKNRAEGYSKNKTFNYTYDIITYSLDAMFHNFGINIPIYYLSRRAKTLFKFAMVGFTGTIVDFTFYNLFIIQFLLPPATAKAFSTEIAIINNFLLNNMWTFRYRKTGSSFGKKIIIFNLVSFGGLAISVGIVKMLHLMYGDGLLTVFGLQVPYYNVYFFAAILPAMVWNFTVNHLVTWRNKTDLVAS